MENFHLNNYYDLTSQLWIDWSNMRIHTPLFEDDKDMVHKALNEMKALEGGAIANPDENRMVGHYWLRNSKIAPTKQISDEIDEALEKISVFVNKVHSGEIKSSEGKLYKNAIVIGVGGSNLGAKFISSALQSDSDKLKLYFIDNTDPVGIDKTLSSLKASLGETIVIIISKSGGTVETRNGMLETQNFFASNNIDFFSNAVCITQIGSKLDKYGEGNWLEVFPMWDWVGGRTSVLSAVGILPLSLQGVDYNALLEGASYADTLTRLDTPEINPALIMAKLWLLKTNGVGGTSMVMLPYRDKLELFSKYLQQLIMESLGKEKDLEGNIVNQGLAVYGNKGSTDQHSYVQQLIGGSDNMFVNFISVLDDEREDEIIVSDNSTTGDYLNAFLMGTEKALLNAGKHNFTITIPELTAYYIGLLVALYERAVGYYAIFIGINPYHQPAVEYGKKAANEIICMKNDIIVLLEKNKDKKMSANEIAEGIASKDVRAVMKILAHLSKNNKIIKVDGETLLDNKYTM